MPNVKCLICETDFYVKPSHQRYGWGKYCSLICRNKSQLKGKQVHCFICNKQVYRSPKDIKSSDSGKFFCSKSCQTIWRNTILFTGENHVNWKYGKSAYRKILKNSGILQVCKLCKTEDERVLIVHHLDKNRNNNNVSNLTWLCLNCHYLVHNYSEELKILRDKNMVDVVQQQNACLWSRRSRERHPSSTQSQTGPQFK